jgi:hypothetical protein
VADAGGNDQPLAGTRAPRPPIEAEGHLSFEDLVALLELRMKVLGEDAAARVGPDLDPQDVASPGEAVALVEERVFEQLAGHVSPPSLVS